LRNNLCECGHTNQHGTIICEKCGRSLDQTNENQLLNMRYEGSARRSKTYNKTIIDKIWNFFSSVKVGVWLIAITTIAASLGTILPQDTFIPGGPAAANSYYEKEYGVVGELYYQLGFHNLYKTWWFTLLLGLIGISIIIASLDRFIPLYRALKKQGVVRHDSFFQRQRLFSKTKLNYESNREEILTNLQEKLSRKRYKVRLEGDSLLAEKNRFSRWGPYVNHIGLILVLIGGVLRFFPGMYVDEKIAVREGETVPVKGTNNEYYLKNEKFIFEIYDEEDDEKFKDALRRTGDGIVPKNYQSDVVLFKQKEDKLPGEKAKLEEVKRGSIQVNHPLKFDSYALYQVNYKLNEFKALTFQLEDRETGHNYGTFTIDLFDVAPDNEFTLNNGYSVNVEGYYPDYMLNDRGLPASFSSVPDNPGFIFKLKEPDQEKPEILALAILNNKLVIPPPFEGFFNDNTMTLRLTDYELRHVTVLTVRKDHTLWLIALGGIIFMIGVIQGMYWHHRRIWVKRSGDDLLIAAHSNKNYYGLQKEIEQILEGTSLNLPGDQYSSKSRNMKG
jgi:cytochrome c biogenesis protein